MFCRWQNLKEIRSPGKWQYKISSKKNTSSSSIVTEAKLCQHFCGPAHLGPGAAIQPFPFICFVDTDAHLILWWTSSGKENQQMFFACLVFSYKDSFFLVYSLKQSKREELQGWQFRLTWTVLESQPEAIVQLEVCAGMNCHRCQKKKRADPILSHLFQEHAAFSSAWLYKINPFRNWVSWWVPIFFFRVSYQLEQFLLQHHRREGQEQGAR